MKAKLFIFSTGIVCLWLAAFRASAATYYVNAGSTAPVAPFTSWATAATNIQDAVNLTTNGDTVLVTNGVYSFGGLIMAGDLVNVVALTNPITVESVNGPWMTTIAGPGATNGAGAVRCAWLTNGASLIGFTLTGGGTRNSGDQNSLEDGGGAWCASSSAVIANCVIVSNSAFFFGGGVYQGTILNSLVSSNGAANISGSAAYRCVLNNCTVTGNTNYGVGSELAMTNCIIYFNLLGNVTGGNSANANCCTTPALGGTGNFTIAPGLFADGVHLTPGSPCIGAGIGTPAGTDISGLNWSNPPSVGCAEWNPVPQIFPQPTAQYLPSIGDFVGVNISGPPPLVCSWLVNGQAVQNNGHYSLSSSPTLAINGFNPGDAGTYQVVVSNSFGMTTSAVTQVAIHCVAAAGTGPVFPFTDWTTAATNIQDAIDAALPGDVILVTNGVYAYGGRSMGANLSTNRVALNKAVVMQSVNGPWVTTVLGGGVSNSRTNSIRCAWMTNGAALIGFTLRAAQPNFLASQEAACVVCPRIR